MGSITTVNETIETRTLCTWRDMFEKKGSTFSDVKTESHPLYKCTLCSGIYGCENYRPIKITHVVFPQIAEKRPHYEGPTFK